MNRKTRMDPKTERCDWLVLEIEGCDWLTLGILRKTSRDVYIICSIRDSQILRTMVNMKSRKEHDEGTLCGRSRHRRRFVVSKITDGSKNQGLCLYDE